MKNGRFERIERFLNVFALLLFACSIGNAGDTFTGKVTRVIDGDTIEVLVDRKPLRVRLWGVDAPERGQPFGTQAKLFTSSLAFGQQVSVHNMGRDRWGRIIGVVVLWDGRYLSNLLVANGYAWHYRRYANVWVLAELEKAARQKRIGLWHDGDAIPPWEFRRQK